MVPVSMEKISSSRSMINSLYYCLFLFTTINMLFSNYFVFRLQILRLAVAGLPRLSRWRHCAADETLARQDGVRGHVSDSTGQKTETGEFIQRRPPVTHAPVTAVSMVITNSHTPTDLFCSLSFTPNKFNKFCRP